VNRRKLAQNFPTAARCKDAHEASVAGTWRLANQTPPASALDQADDGVVALLKKLGQLGNRGPAASREALDPEQELVLLGSQAGGARSLLAKSQEPAQLIARPSQPPLERRRFVLPVS